MTRLLAVMAVGVWAGVALADKPSVPATYTSEGGRYTVVFPAKPSTKEDADEKATTAGNLTIVTTKLEKGAVYSVTYTDYPATYAIAAKDVLDGVVNGMKGSDGKVGSSEQISLDGVAGRSVTITAGENAVRAKVFLNEQRLYIVMVSGKKENTKGESADKFLDSFTFTK